MLNGMEVPTIIRLPVGDRSPEAHLYYGQDVRRSLSQLNDSSVHMVCTSPPYWGLRDYGTEPQVWGGRSECSHVWGDPVVKKRGVGGEREYGSYDKNTGRGPAPGPTSSYICSKCGAWNGDLGLESTPDLYVDHMVEVFREVHRVLRPDGTLWLNLGDTYWGGITTPTTLKPKDLVGIPWRVALALQEDGWWLRNDILWVKKNHLPTPVRDRLACSHEHIFLFTKSRRYFFDLDAIRVPHTSGQYDESGIFIPKQNWFEEGEGNRKMDDTEGNLGPMAGSPRRKGRGLFNVGGKNPGDTWVFPTQPFPGTHFAVWPSAIPKRCIQAGTSEKGCCPKCGVPWVRIVERQGIPPQTKRRRDLVAWDNNVSITRAGGNKKSTLGAGKGGDVPSTLHVTVGWEQGCRCPEQDPIPCTVLDPFSGSGTTGMVALQEGRNYIGLDLNADYLCMAESRVRGEKVKESGDTRIESGSVLGMFGWDL